MTALPVLVAHADWSVSPAKRWLALAELYDGRYHMQPPQPVGEPQTLLSRLRVRARPDGAVLLGVDFPIGLPLAYAQRVGVDHFLALLPQLGRGVWRDFYFVAERPEQISLHRPFYPQRPGSASRVHLLQGLGLQSPDDLLRRCDQARPGRRAAAPLFWTLGGQQVGKAAISGWRDMLAPAVAGSDRAVALWPFDGRLADLLKPGCTVVAEAYPAEYYRCLGITFSTPRAGVATGKRVQAERRQNAAQLLRWADEAGVTLHPELQATITDGFGALASGEDRFDATVGLFGLLNVALGIWSPDEPSDPATRAVEGWILGQPLV